MAQSTKIVLDNSSEQSVNNSIGLPVIDIEDAQTLNGTCWNIARAVSLTATSYYCDVVTPNTSTLANFKLDISTEHPTTGGVTVGFYKSAPTITTTGTALTALNRNQFNTTATTTVKFHAGMVYDSSLSSANLLESHALSATYPQCEIGRYILNKNSRYSLKIASAASSSVSHINATWYEV